MKIADRKADLTKKIRSAEVEILSLNAKIELWRDEVNFLSTLNEKPAKKVAQSHGPTPKRKKRTRKVRNTEFFHKTKAEQLNAVLDCVEHFETESHGVTRRVLSEWLQVSPGQVSRYMEALEGQGRITVDKEPGHKKTKFYRIANPHKEEVKKYFNFQSV